MHKNRWRGALVFLATGLFSGSPASSATIDTFSISGWDGAAYSNNETGRFSSCIVIAKYRNGTSLFFKMGSGYQVDIGVTSPDWSFRTGAEFKATLKVDRSAPFTGQGYAALANSVLFPIETNSSSFNLFRRGRVLAVTFGSQTYRYRLDGTSRALKRLNQCVSDNRYYQRPVAAKLAEPANPDKDRYLMIIDAAAITSNIATSSGLPGFRIVTDEKTRKTAGSPDILWQAQDLVGFTNVYDGTAAKDIEQVAALLLTSGGHCRDVVRSATRRENVNNIKIIHVLSECRNNKGEPFTIQSVVGPRTNGGFFEFTFMPINPAVIPETGGLENAAMTVMTGN